MNDLLQQLSSAVTAAAKPAANERRVARTAPPYAADATTIRLSVQLLIPSLAWNWRVTPTGVIPQQQFFFCDQVPGSCNAAAPQYSGSGKSLVSNYTLFLSALVDSDAIEAARRRLRPPSGSPNDVTAPPGWSKAALDDGVLQWVPQWIVSDTPDAFRARVASQPPDPVTITLDASAVAQHALESDPLIAAVVGTSRTVPLRFDRGDLGPIVIHADAIGRVQASPGFWFDSGIASLYHDGPFRDGLSRAGSLLTCRLGAFVVALGASVQMGAASDVAARNADVLAAATSLQVGPFRTPVPEALGGSSASMAFSANASLDIIGVIPVPAA